VNDDRDQQEFELEMVRQIVAAMQAGDRAAATQLIDRLILESEDPYATAARIQQAAVSAPDTWRDTPLSAAAVVNDADLHYRIYDAKTRVLLGFGTMSGPGALNAVAQDVLRVQAANPGVHLFVQQFSESA
jgi:hypothetical protein